MCRKPYSLVVYAEFFVKFSSEEKADKKGQRLSNVTKWKQSEQKEIKVKYLYKRETWLIRG